MGSPAGTYLLGIGGGNVRQEHTDSVPVVTQGWTSDSGKGHISVAHLRHTSGGRENTLQSRSLCVYTEELSGLKIKSRGNSSWARAGQ